MQSDEEENAGGAREQQQRLPRREREVVAELEHARGPSRDVRILLSQGDLRRVQLLSRLLECRIWREPCERPEQVLRVPLDVRVGGELGHRDDVEWRSHQRGAEKLGAAGQHADHGSKPPVDRILFVEHAASAAEASLPVPVAQNYRVAGLASLLGVEEASDLGGDAEDAEEIRSDGERGDALWPVGTVQRRERGCVQRHSSKRFRARLPVAEIGVRHAESGNALVRIRGPERHELVIARKWEGAQEHGVDHAEDGRVRADAERDGEDDDGRDEGRRPRHTEGEADVLGGVVAKAEGPDFSHAAIVIHGAAVRPARLAAGGGRTAARAPT